MSDLIGKIIGRLLVIGLGVAFTVGIYSLFLWINDYPVPRGNPFAQSVKSLSGFAALMATLFGVIFTFYAIGSAFEKDTKAPE